MAPKRFPPNAVDVDVQVGDRRLHRGARREVLVVGELAVSMRDALNDRGAALTCVDSLSDAFVALAEHGFDVVVVNPFLPYALDLVTAIKETADDHEHTLATLYGARGTSAFLRGVKPPSREQLDAARTMHAQTPFVVLPAGEDWHYAVILKPPGASTMVDARVRPIVTTVMTVDRNPWHAGTAN